MKVAYLVNQYPKVSHTFIRRELQALEARGVPVSRYAVRGWDAEVSDPEDLIERGRTRYVLQRGLPGLLPATLGHCLRQPVRAARGLWQALRWSAGADRSWPWHVVYWMEACWLLEALRREPVDHLHAHFGTNAAEVAALVHAMGGPGFSFTVHGPEEFDRPQALRLADKVRASAFVVAISRFGRSQLWRWLEVAEWSKVRVVHCGLGERFWAQAPAPVPDVPRLVCVGRLCEQKGQLLLVQAVARLRQRGVAIELVLAGDGELRGEIERLIESAGLQQVVRITGWVGGDEVLDWLQRSRAMVLPSFAEGLPVVLMEAMAVGRPVLSTYVAGIPELVRDGEHGWLFPAGDPEALADAMAHCLATPVDRLQRMGLAARERALARHDIREAARRLEAAMAAAAQPPEAR